MAKEHQVSVVSVQPKEDFYRNGNPPFPNNVQIITSAKSKLYHNVHNTLPLKLANAINYRLIRRKLTERTNSYFLQHITR